MDFVIGSLNLNHMLRISLLLATFLIVIGCGQTEEQTITRKTVLNELGKKEVLKRLKSPSTAVFHDSLTTVTRMRRNGEPSNHWRVRISVDAQNSFGAMLRKRYMIIYEETGKDSISEASYKLHEFFD